MYAAYQKRAQTYVLSSYIIRIQQRCIAYTNPNSMYSMFVFMYTHISVWRGTQRFVLMYPVAVTLHNRMRYTCFILSGTTTTTTTLSEDVITHQVNVRDLCTNMAQAPQDSIRNIMLTTHNLYRLWCL